MELLAVEWILNELSLERRYENSNEFLKELEVLFKFKSENKIFGDSFLCPRGIGDVEVVVNKKFSQVIMTEAPRNIRAPVMSWISKRGPFWCDVRRHTEDDYFEYEKIDVTNKGLGECARKYFLSEHCGSFSFSGPFNISPLAVTHGLPEEPIGIYDIENVWALESALLSLRHFTPKPKSWSDALLSLSSIYTNIIFSPKLIEQISVMPFSFAVYDRMNELCRTLSDYLNSRTDEGKSTPRTDEIYNDHFRGRKAWFSDETDADKRDFEHELKFLDSRDNKVKNYSFHGKIKTPQVRIYFEWPILESQKDIQIVYFGPKITKK